MEQHKVPALIFVLLMLLSAAAAIVGPSASTASALTTGDGFVYMIDGDEVTITGYKGASTDMYIPRTVEGKPVTQIAEAAFQNEPTITSAVIPDSVTVIGDRAFEQCPSLTSVIIEGGVTAIGPSTFRGCTALAYIEIPETVTRIDSYAFYGCTALTSITIPSSVDTIDPFAFWNNDDLLTIIFEGPAPAVGTNWILAYNSGLVAYYYPANADSFPKDLTGGVPTSPLEAKPTAPNNLTAVFADGQFTLSWDPPTYPGASGIDRYVINVDNVAQGDTTATSYTISGLRNGDIHSFCVLAQSGGTAGQSSIVIAAIPLGVSIIHPSANGAYYTSRTGTIGWDIEASSEAARTEISIDGGAWTEVSGTSYEFTVASEGEHTAKVRVTSFVDSTETASRTFVVDTIAPTVTGRSPQGSDVAVGSAIIATFSETMNASSVAVDVSDINGSLSWDGDTVTLTPSSPLAYGTEYTVTVTGTDLAGNPVEAAWKFTTMKDEGSVSGVVKDKDGKAVADADVKLSNGMSASTDANGYFKFEHVPSGNYTLTVEKDGYDIMVKRVTVSAGVTSDLGTIDLKGSGGDNTWLIVAVVIVVAAAVVVLFSLMRRSRSGQ